ncbi:hypothetical protein F4782DRAFT_511019 [Xylaria castorea]|nr:hypothetical protein F4782DRAFT_511019 [Xylaria castorea]
MEVEIPNLSSLSPAQKQELLLGPAIAPPPGMEARLGDPVPSSPGILFFITTSAVLSTFFVATRAYVRLRMAKSLSLPDVLTFIAYGLLIGLIAVFYKFAVDIGFYVHQWNISLKYYSNYQYFFHIVSCLYAVILLTTKAAILLEWVSIFAPRTRSTFSWVCHTLLGINVAFYLALLILANTICTPLEHTWDPLTEGHCNNGKLLLTVSAAVNSMSDLVIFILPQTVIWKLNMTQKQKLGCSIVFAIGFVAVVASIIRLASLLYYYRQADETYNTSAFLLWSLAEVTAIFLVLCVPSAPKALHDSKLLRYIFSTLPLRPKKGVDSHQPSSHRQAKESGSHCRTPSDGIPLTAVESGTP